MKNNQKIYIIGAGVSGLIAAINLEKEGLSPTIIEADNAVGGRVQNDIVNDYILDRGFQVLLTSYPAAQKFLDYNKLDLSYFLPGAVIFKNKTQKVIGDPTRSLQLLIPTLFSGIGTIKDKFKILQLNRLLKKKSIDDIFKTKEQTTLSYLEDFGFSENIIHDFFQPFFSGIFLETKLNTSSRMFEFVYKMFGEGLAAIPKKGIGEITKQLHQQLKNTTILFNTKVKEVSHQKITLENGDVLSSDYIIVTANHSDLIPNLKNQKTAWKSCYNLYFELNHKNINKPLIGLVPDKNSIINNIVFSSSLQTNPNNNHIISVTVVDNQNLTEEELITKVSTELDLFCNIKISKFLKMYFIPKSLPDIDHLQYESNPSETQLTQSIFLAGDLQLNGSLNAAMLSGEKAALGVLEAAEKTIIN